MNRAAIHALSLCLCMAMAAPAQAVAIGQTDDFEDGTTQGWVVAVGPVGGVHPAPPANIASGGPGGVDDNYLLLTSLGGTAGAGSRLAVLNLSQWAGDYTVAGITAIRMSVRNFGDSDLSLRLLFEDPGAGPPANIAVSTDAIDLPAGGEWTDIVFPVLPGDLTALTGTIDAALSGATAIRLYHSPTPVFPPVAVSALLGVDDITAVPEPPALALIGAGLLGLLGLRLTRFRR